MKTRQAAIASSRHTIILCLILLGIALVGLFALHSGGGVAAPASPSGLILGLIAAEAALLYYVWIGIRRYGIGLRELVWQGRATAMRAVTDLAIGIALFLVLTLVGSLVARWIGAGDTSIVNSVVSAAARQPALWVVVSLAAAVCANDSGSEDDGFPAAGSQLQQCCPVAGAVGVAQAINQRGLIGAESWH